MEARARPGARHEVGAATADPAVLRRIAAGAFRPAASAQQKTAQAGREETMPSDRPVGRGAREGSAEAGGARPSSVDEDKTRDFKAWLRGRLATVPLSLHAIEVNAGIPGNGLGKFRRSERGTRHSLTPLNIRRLAPVILVSEERMLAMAGHLSHEPESVSVPQAILADESLDYAGKLFLMEAYRRATAGR
jgi:hypothetical protein